MKELDLEGRAVALKALYEDACRTPFPYAGTRILLDEAGGSYQSIIPDLDLYFSSIAGYCSWGKRILKWDKKKVEEAKGYLEKPFFAKHPEYKPLESIITQEKTPDLLSNLHVHEEMRRELFDLLTILQSKESGEQ